MVGSIIVLETVLFSFRNDIAKIRGKRKEGQGIEEREKGDKYVYLKLKP